jgi:hypothetical protein
VVKRRSRQTKGCEARSRTTHRRYAQVPRTRSECRAVERPCPFYSCRYHIWADIKLRAGILPDESCALDVADEGVHTLEEVGQIFGLTRERVRQILAAAIAKLRRRGAFLRQ